VKEGGLYSRVGAGSCASVDEDGVFTEQRSGLRSSTIGVKPFLLNSGSHAAGLQKE
jgi:hypothetical protein